MPTSQPRFVLWIGLCGVGGLLATAALSKLLIGGSTGPLSPSQQIILGIVEIVVAMGVVLRQTRRIALACQFREPRCSGW